jgi:predicted nucleic acid-binding Zn ribbon protein
VTDPRPSGVDLARVALRAARENARTSSPPAQKAPAPRRGSRGRAGGRDLVGLGAAMESLIADRAWEVPVQGGSVLEQWPVIAGDDLAAHVSAVHFDPDTGCLDLRPDSPAYRMQIRLLAPRLLARIREVLSTDAVRRIRDLAPGTPPGTGQPEEPAGPGPGRAPRRAAEVAVSDQRTQRPAPDDQPTGGRAGQFPPPEPEEGLDPETAERRRKALSHARALAFARREKAARKAGTDTLNQQDR